MNKRKREKKIEKSRETNKKSKNKIDNCKTEK